MSESSAVEIIEDAAFSTREWALGCDNCGDYGHCLEYLENDGASTRQCLRCACTDGVTGVCCDRLPKLCANDSVCRLPRTDNSSVAPSNRRNNRVCAETGPLSYQCVCPPGYTGPKCDQLIDYCTNESPNIPGCSVLGTSNCSSSIFGPFCECRDEFTGTFCETKLPDHCDRGECVCGRSPCANNATCYYNGTGQYYCRCLPGYYGRHCGRVSPCLSANPCQHGGVCHLLDATNDPKMAKRTYVCQCPSIWAGENCTDFNACSQQPCQYGGNCTNLGNPRYRCACPNGTTGKNCEDVKDFCSPNPCKESARCISLIGDFQCLCPSGTLGKRCDINPDDCFDRDTLSDKCLEVDKNAKCIDGHGSFRCVCSVNFTGRECDIAISDWDLLQYLPDPENDEQLQFVRDLIADASTMSQAIPFFIANWTREQQEGLSWNVDDLFIWAAYSGKELNISHALRKFFHPSLGTCFTFNADNSSTLYQIGEAGENAGFQALMRVRENDYLPWVDAAAITVFVHPQDEVVLLDSARFFATPGSWNQFAISQTQYERLGGITGVCIDDPSEVHSFYYPGRYTTEGCVSSCYQNAVRLSCGCTDPRHLNIEATPPIPVCGVDKGACVLDISDVHGEPSTWAMCDCPEACNESYFDAQIFGAEFALNHVLYPSCALKTYNASQCSQVKAKLADQVGISVYFAKNAQAKYVETLAQDFNQYLSYFGGVAGLIAGFCMVSLIELSLLIYRLILTFCTNESVSMEQAQAAVYDDDDIL